MQPVLAGSPLIRVILGMAATFLVLSILVQIVQEMWKFVFVTRAGVYTRVLEDFLGSWAKELSAPGVLRDFQARRSYQFWKIRPHGELLPLSKPDLIEGLERTAGVWPRRALRALRLEAQVQQRGPAAPSVEWLRFVRDLTDSDPDGPDSANRAELLMLLGEIGTSVVGGSGKPFDAATTLAIFRERFFSRVLDVERNFGRLEELFEYQYRRRNLWLTFCFGFATALVLGLPVQRIKERASAMSTEEALTLASNAQAAAARFNATDSVSAAPTDSARFRNQAAQADSLLALLRRGSTDSAASTERIFQGYSELRALNGVWPQLQYLGGCILSAILVSFGAPFWNNLVTALATRVRGTAAADTDSQEDRSW